MPILLSWNTFLLDEQSLALVQLCPWLFAVLSYCLCACPFFSFSVPLNSFTGKLNRTPFCIQIRKYIFYVYLCKYTLETQRYLLIWIIKLLLMLYSFMLLLFLMVLNFVFSIVFYFFMCILYCGSFCFVDDNFKIYYFINWVYNKKIENKKFSILRRHSLVYWNNQW